MWTELVGKGQILFEPLLTSVSNRTFRNKQFADNPSMQHGRYTIQRKTVHDGLSWIYCVLYETLNELIFTIRWISVHFQLSTVALKLNPYGFLKKLIKYFDIFLTCTG